MKPHVLITKETCPCDKRSDTPCNVCDGGLAICSVCGKAERELDEPCVPMTDRQPETKLAPDDLMCQTCRGKGQYAGLDITCRSCHGSGLEPKRKSHEALEAKRKEELKAIAEHWRRIDEIDSQIEQIELEGQEAA